MRKDFTVSELVAIAAALEEEMGERRGNPKLKKGNDSIIGDPVRQLDQNQDSGLQGKRAPRTTDIVANRSGLGSGKTYQQAKKVVTHGTPELCEAMDKKDMSIKNAAVIADPVPGVGDGVLRRSTSLALIKSCYDVNMSGFATLPFLHGR